MAGGLFGRPFVFNIKCIIFSLICMVLFLYKPHFNNSYMQYGTLFIIFVLSYVAMAWYDYYFNCDILPLKKGKYSLQQFLKPPAHQPQKQLEQDNQNNIDNRRRLYLIYSSHILLIVPLLAYLALYKNKVNPMVYPIIGVLATFTLLYHGFSLISSMH